MSDSSSHSEPEQTSPAADAATTPHKRRVRYSGKNPKRFADKYKEHQPQKYADTVAKVRASGKTPASHHVPIMVAEIMKVLAPQKGERAVDCTLGYGGHSQRLLKALQPEGCLLGLDQDPIEIQKTEPRLRALGYPETCFIAKRTNFAALRKVIDETGWHDGVDIILADLGVSSMQLDNPDRGFSFKHDGPLDMRMNPQRGISAREFLNKISAEKLEVVLQENADEPYAAIIAKAIAGRDFSGTQELATAVKKKLPSHLEMEDGTLTARRVFQALRIAVNDEFRVLDSFLRDLPSSLRPGGRVAILTFHSGEDRRVKRAFQSGLREGLFSQISEEVQRPTPDEVRLNSRAASAKLRWAVKADV